MEFLPSSDAGFFYILDGANVSDLHFDSSCYFHGSWAGALAVKTRTSDTTARIKNVSNSGTVNGGGIAGGIVSIIEPGSNNEFEGCWNVGNITVERKDGDSVAYCSAGGICGHIFGNARFINCHNYGHIYSELYKGHEAVTSSTSAGRIIGSMSGNVVKESCSNFASVNAFVPCDATSNNPTATSGGIIGSLFTIGNNDTSVEISNCVNKGDISSFSENPTFPVYSGGVMGLANVSESRMNVKLEECQNSGNVNASSTTTSGSIVSSGIICSNNQGDMCTSKNV